MLGAKDGSLRDADLQHDVVRLGLASGHHLSLVVEEFRHSTESTAINFKPSFKYVHDDRMVDGVEDG